VSACLGSLAWESEKDFIDLRGIKNQVTQEAREPYFGALHLRLARSLLAAEIKPF
jgi:hypothetical protein